MSIDILPVETLEQIFSSDLNQVDLARLCQVSKLFRDIVRPQLYRSVTLQSIRQANQLKNSSEEDVKLVEEVRIVGKGDCFPVMKAKELRKAFFAMSEIERLGKEAGVVEELLEGKIVNPAQLKKLFVHRVVEDHGTLPFDGYGVTPQVFSSLTDLSLVSHRGGLETLSQFVKPSYLPSLERLVVYEVDWRKDEEHLLPCWVRTLEGPTYIGLRPEYRLLEIYLDALPPPQLCNLKILVSPSADFLHRFPSVLHLASLDGTDHLRSFEKYVVVHVSTRLPSDGELGQVFDRLETIATDPELSLKYLALPSDLEHHLYPHQTKTLNDLVNLDVSVHFDGDLGSVIAPPSFFEFRKKEEEEDKQRKSQGLSED